MLAWRIIALLAATVACKCSARRLQNASALTTAKAGMKSIGRVADKSPQTSGIASTVPTPIWDLSNSLQWPTLISPITRLRGGSNPDPKGSWNSLGQDKTPRQRRRGQFFDKSGSEHKQDIEDAILRASRMDNLKFVLDGLEKEMLVSARMENDAQASSTVEQHTKGMREGAQHDKDDPDDCEISLGSLKAAICDPSVMAEAAQLLNDPVTLARVKRKMADPKFQKQAKHVAQEIMADSELVMHMFDDHLAETSRKRDPIEEVMHDTETSEHVRDMMADPTVQKQANHIAEQMATRITSKVSCSTVALLSLFDL